VSLTPYFQHLLLLMALVLVASAARNFAPIGQSVGVTLSCVIALMVCLVMALPSRFGPRLLPPTEAKAGTDSDSARPLMAGEEQEDSSLSPSTSAAAAAEHDKAEDELGGRTVTVDFVSFYGRHLCVTEVMREWRCYALMFVFTCTAGSGLFVINNIVAVAATVGQDASSFFVVVLSLANAVGRMSIGVIADRLAHRLSRIQLLACTALVMASAQFLLALNTHELLYPSLVIVGLSFGASFSNISAIVGDLFGAKFIGSNYGFIDLSPTIGSYVFATGLIALFYPSNEDDDYDDDDEEHASCEGARCLQNAFFVTTAACVVASVAGFALHAKTPIIKDITWA
jgi:hypothetical protein